YGLADVYKRPSVRAVAAGSDFAAEQLVGDGPATLILVAPESDAERYAPLFTAIVASVVRAAEAKAATAGGPIDPRLLLALDEAGNTFRFPRLASLLATARGNGIQVLAVYHDLSQLERLYGREQARTVVSNARMRMLLPGVGDLETLRYFAELLGRARTEQRNITRARDGHTSTSTGETSVDLAPVHALQQLPTGAAVAQYTNLPPRRVRLRFCFRDRALRSLMDVEEVSA
ncbi:MAG: type IV secretory system conjugative DNA transfer family protein, partial [Actinomycetes bacterium]